MLRDRTFCKFSLKCSVIAALALSGITENIGNIFSNSSQVSLKVNAQTIVPASDEIKTQIEQNNNIYTIEGGLRSGHNLFHSFQEFGLNAGDVANFLSNPNTQNILTRIVGGNPSLINGLIQVTGGNSNLYLMNPAGIVFGANASLNVPGDFFATTATGIGFSEGLFNIFGENNYANLTGTPLTFEFDLENPAPIINAGHLTVNPEQNLGLVGGSIINTGTLSAKGGSILITAVPGTNRVKLSHPDSLLSLEIDIPLAPDGQSLPITPLDLPQLLVGAEQQNIVTGLTQNITGEIQTAIGAIVPQGVGTTFISGNVDVRDITVGGDIGIFGDRVILNNTRIDASGNNGGGTILVGGDYQGQGSLPTASYTSLDHNTIVRADATDRGNGGKIIVWSDENTEIHGTLTARGGVNFGNGGLIETSSKQTLQITSTPDASATLGMGGTWLIDPTNIRICNACIGSGAIGTSIIDVNNINTALNSGTGVTITTSIGGVDVGNIIQDTDALIQKTSGATTVLLFYAHNDIILQGGIESTSGQLYTGIFADGADPVSASPSVIPSDNFGRIVISKPIISNGGNIRLYGQNSQANLAAIDISANIDSGGGFVDIQGVNYSTAVNDSSHGVAINSNISSGSGAMNIQGSSINGQGVNIDADVISNTGKIEITGTSVNYRGIKIKSSGLIASNNGEINLMGNSTNDNGIHLNTGTSIASGGGDISLVGNSVNDDGIDLNGDISSGGGEINLWGQNQQNGGLDDQGVEISGNLLSSGGNIIITGMGNSVGIDVANTIDSGGGSIALQGTSPNGVGVLISNTLNSGMGTIDITTDTLDLSNLNAALTGSSSLIFRPENSNQTLTLGGTGAADTTFLNTTEMSRLQNGFSEIRIEDNLSNTAIVKLDSSANFQDPLMITNVAELIGPDSNRNWTLTGNQQGNLSGYSNAVLFNNIATIRGGSGQDTFAFNTGVNFNGIVDGGGGIDTLNYANYGSSAIVDLANNMATGTLGAFNIENVVNVTMINPLPIAHSSVTPPSVTPPSVTPPSVTPPISSQPSLVYTPLLTTPSPNIDRLLSSLGEDDRQGLKIFDRQQIANMLDSGDLESAIALLDRYYSDKFLRYLGKEDRTSTTSFADIQQVLQKMERETGTATATIYVFARPEQLDLILIPPTGDPLRYNLPHVSHQNLLAQVQTFQHKLVHPAYRRLHTYLPASQQLHQWLIAPLKEDLQHFGIDTLTFVLDDGLRTLPIAALHDGKHFLIENYAISLVPSLYLLPSHYTDIRKGSIVAMGMSEFSQQAALPAVPVEVATVAEHFRAPETFLNETFTFDALHQEPDRHKAQIVHLATHGQFQPGEAKESYIQLWDRALTLEEMENLNWGENIELLVLSACRTALGDTSAEYGFAGLSVQTGVNSAVASLWYADDAGTLALMGEFYNQLRSTPTKADALRRAQIAMISGEVRLEKTKEAIAQKQEGELVSPFGRVTLPPQLAHLGNRSLGHPYYWAGFTMIGSPW